MRWGSYGDSEPPDPDYYCQKCVESEKEFYRKQGRPPSSYRPSNWEVDLAHELGYEREPYGWKKKEANRSLSAAHSDIERQDDKWIPEVK